MPMRGHAMQTAPKRTHTVENASFTARSTELAWTFHRAYDDVWDAVVGAAPLCGLAVTSADRRVGMAVARPPFSLLNVGRRVAFTFSRVDEDRTLVRATLIHGYMSLQSRRSRQQSLDLVFRMALETMRRKDEDERTLEQARQRSMRQDGPAPPAEGNAAPTPPPAPDTAAKPDPPADQPATGASERPTPPGAPASGQENAPGGRQAQAAPSGTPAPAQPPQGGPGLHAMNFGDTAWENLPLTPPSGAEASRYRHRLPDKPEPGIMRSVLWFILGLGLAFVVAMAIGGLSMLLN